MIITIIFYLCFFSTDEGEREDLDEVHVMENGYEVHAPSPVVPPSLLAQQVQSFNKRAHSALCSFYLFTLVHLRETGMAQS